MRVAIVADGTERQGGTNEIISHILKSLDGHDVSVHYVRAERYLNRHLRKWEHLARILYLRNISKIDFSNFDVVITLQPDSHCIRHKNHVVYFQHHLKQYYELFWPTLRHRKGIRKKVIFLLLAMIVRIADQIYLTPNLRKAHVIANSKTVADRLKRYNGISRFSVINPGCNSTVSIPTTSHKIPNGKNELPVNRNHHSYSNSGKKMEFHALSFSRLSLIQKGIDISIDTARLVPDCDLMIAGPYDATIESINPSSLPINVHLIVKDFSEKEKIELFSNCDVFLAPYMQEDFGITPLEANALGKPVVYCDDGGEIVHTQVHRETGFMCERTPEEIAFGIRYCIENGRNMASACINNAARYSWNAFEKAFKNYILNLNPCQSLD
jgi:glycosyltransferase involved in cell wall biosynthesis